ncbi:MAG: SH3 domain-containing protein [Myxococcales bacterium]|nr:SH3 domain-containing protein [Myxococcales bacterium]
MLKLFKNRVRVPISAIALVSILLETGCSQLGTPTPTPTDSPPLRDIAVYHRAETQRADQLSIEVKRLRADLLRAEEALIKVESGLRGNHTRANAVSELAEARILVKRAAQRASWRTKETSEAQSKLAEAERQVQQGNPGAALFFVYRARRIAELGLLEAKTVRSQPDTFFVVGDRVNLRAGPTTSDRVLRVLASDTPVFVERSKDEWFLVRVISGSAGWIHKSLVRR